MSELAKLAQSVSVTPDAADSAGVEGGLDGPDRLALVVGPPEVRDDEQPATTSVAMPVTPRRSRSRRLVPPSRLRPRPNTTRMPQLTGRGGLKLVRPVLALLVGAHLRRSNCLHGNRVGGHGGVVEIRSRGASSPPASGLAQSNE